MNSIERFFATIERKEVDRPASWLGLPVPSATQGLCDYFKINRIEDMTRAINDDVYAIEMPYHSPDADAIYTALNFAQDFEGSEEERTLTADGFFKDFTEADINRIDEFNWPDPTDYVDVAEAETLVADAPEGKLLLGVCWSSHFQDACAAFGMEHAMMKMALEPEIYRAVNEKIVEFYLKANEIFFKAMEGKLHAILIGNDLGGQTGLLLSPDMIREFVLPGTKALTEQAHRYGFKVIHHSCGAIRDIIGDLIETGVDVIHPIQALATGMQPQELKDNFGDKVAFCGGVDAQNLLVNGSPEEVSAKIRELYSIFGTGLVLSPSHEAILPDVPPENIETMFKTINELAR
ncbi:MAG: uroporphyrinogen decarboxylase family protein [Spirochaetales bacterium]|nr:uroporphyrinogen decarboxylase family protein [Spirochaetales bacterium]